MRYSIYSIIYFFKLKRSTLKEKAKPIAELWLKPIDVMFVLVGFSRFSSVYLNSKHAVVEYRA